MSKVAGRMAPQVTANIRLAGDVPILRWMRSLWWRSHLGRWGAALSMRHQATDRAIRKQVSRYTAK
jgi:hypothetical protein